MRSRICNKDCRKNIQPLEFSLLLEKKLEKLDTRIRVNNSPIVQVIKNFAYKWNNWKQAPRNPKGNPSISRAYTKTKGDTHYEVSD